MGKTRAQFYKDEFTGRDMVRIWAVGDQGDIHQKVTPDHIARFPADWAAYEQGKGEVEIAGTPLIEVPGVDKHIATALKLKHVRTAEELAALDDAAAQTVGLNGRTLVKAAKNLLLAKKYEALEADTAPPKPRARKEQPQTLEM